MTDGLEPVSIAIVVCDAIHVDSATGKRTLLGLFTALFSTEFPVRVPTLAVYALLTECRGTFSVMLQVVDVNEERDPVAKVQGETTHDDPLAMLEIDFRLSGIEFPEPGEYRIQLFAAGTFVGERRLAVLRVPSKGDRDE